MNEFRATLGLPPVDRLMHRWMHSPQLVIGFFPDWFATPQPDWPPETHLVGFPLWDSGDRHHAVRTRASFSKPANHRSSSHQVRLPRRMHRYFQESVAAARELGVRAMLVTNFPEQVPTDLPSHVKTFGYLPFSELLPHAAAARLSRRYRHAGADHQGGNPASRRADGHDQFDNAWRIEQLGLGRSIPQTQYRANRVAAAIRAILADGEGRARWRDYASRMDSDAALTRACELIEGLSR